MNVGLTLFILNLCVCCSEVGLEVPFTLMHPKPEAGRTFSAPDLTCPSDLVPSFTSISLHFDFAAGSEGEVTMRATRF